MKKLIPLFIVFATLSGAAFGKTVYVNANYPANGDGTSWSSPYTNLQDAVDAAAGDLVLVTNGVYSPISTGNKSITIQSVEGSSVTSIDGGGTTRCATLGTGVVLKGFTVFNGYTTSTGGGVMYGSIYDSVVSNNLAMTLGGGIYNATVISNCVVACNVARSPSDGVVGGGIYGNGVTVVMDSLISGNIATNTYAQAGGVGYATVYRCRIENNMARNGGGTYRCDVYDNSTIVSNIATYAGGGVGTYTANMNKIHDSTIEYNRTIAAYGGGTLFMIGSNCVIRGNTASSGGGTYGGTLYNSIISNNLATQDGGGVYGGTVTDSIISRNSATRYGGGTSNATISNSVISLNSSVNRGGGAYLGKTYNCVISRNSSVGQHGAGVFQGHHYNGTIVYNTGLSSAIGTNCRIYNTVVWSDDFSIWGAIAEARYSVFTDFSANNGSGNITDNPLFVNSATNDFRLASNSPCINKGANQYVTTSTDFAGRPRIKDWRVDMGAYESQSPRFVTTPNALFPMGTKDVK